MEILTLLSDWYVAHERYSDNLKLLEGVFEDHVVDAHLAYNLALSYQNTGDIKKAANNYELAADELSDNPDFLKHATLFYREIGKPDLEKQSLKKYLDLVPDDMEMEELWDEMWFTIRN